MAHRKRNDAPDNPKVKVFDLPIFNITITISFCADSLVAHIGEEFRPLEKHGAEVATWTKDGIPGVSIYLDPDHYCASMLTHESIHAAWRVLDICGVVVTSENHETLAYLAGYISAQVNNMYDRAWAKEGTE